MTAAPAYTMRDLLRHVSAELLQLAIMADEVQHAAMDVAMRPSPEHQMAERVLVTLQSLDSISQVLRDLHRLADRLALTRIGLVAVDESAIRQALILTSLADRLVGAETPDDGDAGFLL